MTRVKRGNVARKSRNKILELNRGYRGSHSTLFRTANQRTLKEHLHHHMMVVVRKNVTSVNYGLSVLMEQFVHLDL